MTGHLDTIFGIGFPATSHSLTYAGQLAMQAAADTEVEKDEVFGGLSDFLDNLGGSMSDDSLDGSEELGDSLGESLGQALSSDAVETWPNGHSAGVRAMAMAHRSHSH